MDQKSIHDVFLERLHVLLVKFRKTGKMTVAQIRVVNTFVREEIKEKNILETSASELFRIRFIVSIMELTTLSSDNLEAAAILAGLYAKLLSSVTRHSKVWEISRGVYDSLVGYLTFTTTNDIFLSKQQINIAYDEGKTMSILVASLQHVWALFMLLITAHSAYCSHQSVGGSAISMTYSIQPRQLMVFVETILRPSPMSIPPRCILQLIDACSQPFAVIALSSIQRCSVAATLGHWIGLQMKILTKKFQGQETMSDTGAAVVPHLQDISLSFVRMVRRMLHSDSENSQGQFLEDVQPTGVRFTSSCDSANLELPPSSDISTALAPERVKGAMSYLILKGEWGDSKDSAFENVITALGVTNTSLIPELTQAHVKQVIMEYFNETNTKKEYQRQHPNPVVRRGWLNFTPHSSRQPSLVQLVRGTDNVSFVSCLCRTFVTYLGADNIEIESSSIGDEHIRHTKRGDSYATIKPVIVSFLNAISLCAFSCPAAACSTPGLLEAVARIAWCDADCLHEVCTLFSLLLASSPATSSCILSWAVTSIDGTNDTQSDSPTRRKRRASSISICEENSEEAQVPAAVHSTMGSKRRLRGNSGSEDQWDRYLPSSRFHATQSQAVGELGPGSSPDTKLSPPSESADSNRSTADILDGLLPQRLREDTAIIPEYPELVRSVKAIVSRCLDAGKERICEIMIATELLLTTTSVSLTSYRASPLGNDLDFLPGGPWARNCSMETCLEKYVNLVERAVREPSQNSDRIKVVIASLGRVLAGQPFLFRHCAPPHGLIDLAGVYERGSLETRLIAAITQLCNLPYLLEGVCDLLCASVVTSAPIESPVHCDENGKHEDPDVVGSRTSEVWDALWRRQLPPGLLEMQAIGGAMGENKYQDILAGILCKSMISIDNDKSALDLLVVMKDALESNRSAPSATVWKRALLKAYSRWSAVMLPCVGLHGDKTTVRDAPIPVPFLRGISSSMVTCDSIMESICQSNSYWSLFPSTFFKAVEDGSSVRLHNSEHAALGANILSNIVVSAVRIKWISTFHSEICQLVSVQTASPFLSNIWRVHNSCCDIDILRCAIAQNQPGNLGSASGMPPCKVLELCHAACAMRGWMVAHRLPVAAEETFFIRDHVEIAPSDDLVVRVWEVVRERIETLLASIVDAKLLQAGQGDIGSENLDEFRSFVNLLVMLRLWCGVNRCCKYGTKLQSGAGISEWSGEDEMGTNIDISCRRLSEFVFPHSALTKCLSDLLSLGMLDASFKWRLSAQSAGSGMEEVDIWWEKAVVTGVQPGGILAGASSALHRAVDDLAKEETIRGDIERGSTKPLAVNPPSAETVVKRTVTTWMCIPAFAQLVKTTAWTEPEIALWALSTLIQAADAPPGYHACGWVYYMVLETFVELCAGGGTPDRPGVVLDLLTGDNSQLAADIFFRPVLHSPGLLELMKHVAIACGFDFGSIINIQLPFIIHSCTVFQDGRAYVALRQDVFKTTTESRTLSRAARVNSSKAIATLRSASSKETPATSNEEALNSSRSSNGQASFTSVISKNPMCIFRILASDVMLSANTQELIHGQFLDVLESQYAMPLSKSLMTDDSRSKFLIVGAVQRMLRHIVWHLGSHSQTVVSTTQRVLRIMCTLIRGNSWAIPEQKMVKRKHSRSTIRTEDEVDGVSSNLDSNVAYILNKNFLYILTNAIQKNWTSDTLDAQSQSLRLLSLLLKLLRADDLGKFLPKILFTTDTALGSPSARVRIAAIRVIGDLIMLLPHEVLRNNVAQLLVGLYPIIENCGKQEDQSAAALALNELLAQLKRPILDIDLERPSESDGLYGAEPTTQEASKKLESICFFLHGDALQCIQERSARSQAISVINSLFQMRWEVIRPAATSLVYLPDLRLGLRAPGEEDFNRAESLLRVEHNKLTTQQTVLNLCNMLKLESTQLKIVALNGLTAIWAQHGHSLNASIVSLPGGALAKDALICTVLRHLLELSVFENDSEVRAACARCLGELGALDPAKVSFALHNSKAIVDQDAPNPIPQQSDGQDQGREYQLSPPWTMSEWEFSILLIEKHLVPGLRVAAGNVFAQDRICFAIQETLSKMARSKMEALGLNVADNFKDNSMPAVLREELAKRNILELTEPYWSSNYAFNEAPAKLNCPIFRSNYSAQRWIGLWCRYLLFRSRGPFSEYFSACRGAVRTRAEMSQFLLPYLVVDVLAFPPRSTDRAEDSLEVDDDAEKDRAVIMSAIVEEICTVLRVGADATSASSSASGSEADATSAATAIAATTSIRPGRLSRGMLDRVAIAGFRGTNNASSHMSVHAVFTLLDTLGLWSSLAKSKGAKEKTSAVYGSITEKVRASVIGLQLDALIDAVPKALLGHAAVRIGAHARGMRYFELLAREEHLALRSSAQNQDFMSTILTATPSSSMREISVLLPPMKRYDCANGALPVLSVAMVDAMMEICASLEDADALQGIEKMRQIYSYPSTSYNRLLQMEHTDSWMDALQEYDRLQMQLELPTERSDSEDVEAARAFVERGRMRCMLEMGQLEAVLDQVQGRSARSVEVEPALLPAAVRASWQLQKWDLLDEVLCRCEQVRENFAANEDQNDKVQAQLPSGWPSFMTDKYSQKKKSTPLRIHSDDSFEVAMGYLMSCVHRGHRKGLEMAIKDFRVETMASLATACAESYNRAYPFLVRLHILREAEQAFELVHCADTGDDAVSVGIHSGVFGLHTPQNATRLTGSLSSTESIERTSPVALTRRRNRMMSQWKWDTRINLLSPSVQHRSSVLAFRRSIMKICDMQQHVAENWMTISKLMRKTGRYDMARLSIRNAVQSGLEEEDALIQESIILKESGYTNKALMLLEPVEIDIARLRFSLKSDPKGEVSTTLLGLPKRHKELLAHKLLLTAKLMGSSHIRHGEAITDRYKVALALHKDWEAAVFELGQYYSIMAKYHKNDLPSGNFLLKVEASEVAYISASIRAVESYIQSVRYGHEHLMQALPKLLTTWFSITSLTIKTEPGVGDSKAAIEAANVTLARYAKKMNGLMNVAVKKFTPQTWFACMPQIVSRIGHSNVEVVGYIKEILAKILATFPEQGLWFLACLKNSLSPERQEHGEAILQAARRELSRSGNTSAARMVAESSELFNDLVLVAREQPAQRRSALTISYPVRSGDRPGRDSDIPSDDATAALNDSFQLDDHVYFPSDQMRILKFDENVDVMATKAKPKRIQLFTTCGKTIKFLLKQEQNGDLRKDARMMDFNAVVNRIMQEEPESRKRKLRLRTYSVVCLNEECGILEWVPNTSGFRPLVMETSAANPDLYPSPNFRDLRVPFEDAQKRYGDNIEKLVDTYAAIALKQNVPCFHRWFLNVYQDPRAWLDARTTFTRSCAVWSAVGHVIGLGDRHGENILLDMENAECIHVDFDCIFDKGLTLARPEIVPFRLTPNMVDAMGLTGVEGCFRCSMEVCLGLLRDNKDPLLSVIEPFIRDPTVAWGRGGRAQRGGDETSVRGRRQHQEQQFEDTENANAGNILKNISERLDGIYNIRHPYAKNILLAYRGRKQPPPRIGLGASGAQNEEDMLALSVPGQVQKLIEEATSENNLAQMMDAVVVIAHERLPVVSAVEQAEEFCS